MLLNSTAQKTLWLTPALKAQKIPASVAEWTHLRGATGRNMHFLRGTEVAFSTSAQ